MNKLNSIIYSMNYSELKAIEKDLFEGNIGNLIKQRKLEFESDEKICPTCGNLFLESEANYTLIFGPKDFKKKASFCGIDCLNYFIEKLKPKENLIKDG